MATFNVKLRYSVIHETEIEVEAPTAIAAMDSVRERCKKKDLPQFEVARKTEPHVVAVEETTPPNQTS